MRALHHRFVAVPLCVGVDVFIVGTIYDASFVMAWSLWTDECYGSGLWLEQISCSGDTGSYTYYQEKNGTVSCDDAYVVEVGSASTGCMNESAYWMIECDSEVVVYDSESTEDPFGNGAGALSVAVVMVLSVAGTLM